MDDAIKTQAQTLFQNGFTLLQKGMLEEADKLFADAHQLNSENIDALNLLGIRSYQKLDYKNALSFLNKANTLAPNCAETLNSLGLVYDALSLSSDALEFFNAALAIKSNIPEFFNNRGNALRNLKRSEEAKKAYAEAVALRPNYCEALSNYGTIFLEAGEPEKAILLFEKAIIANANFAPALSNLGSAFTLVGQYENAFKCFEKALQIQPNYIDAYLNFGNALKECKQYSAAIDCYQEALKYNINHSKTFFLLGEVYFEIGENALAKTYYGKCLDLNPTNLLAQYALSMAQLPKVYQRSGEIDASRTAFSNQLDTLSANNPLADSPVISAAAISRHPFYLAYQPGNNAPLLSRYGCICVNQAQSIQTQINLIDREPKIDAKFRLGIISHYFSDHPVWHAITKGWVKRLDSDLFEIYLFNTDGTEDHETRLAQSSKVHYINCGKDLSRAAATIAKTNLDALIYPEIGMDATSKGLACLRLAPLQAASWGHPETTGLSTIDYFISAELLEPPHAENFYTEKLICLPGLGGYLEQPSIETLGLDLGMLGIDKERPILICAGSPSKYLPENDFVFAEIAKRLGECQFLFFNFEENLTAILKERLEVVFSNSNLVSNNYIRFIPFLKREEFFGLLRASDVYLDTIGFSGFNTALQALSCELPIVTLEGPSMRGRLASAILNKLRLQKFICNTHHAYIEQVVNLIKDPSLFKDYKERISKTKHLLFRDQAPIRALEKFLIHN
jgi:predicted O-linked N-acetylglucosamine transferase (SPINDLY family)